MARPRVNQEGKKQTRKDYPGSIRRRGRGWQVRLKLGGREYPYVVEGTREEAEEFARREHQRLSEWQKRTSRGFRGRIRFSQLLREFREHALANLKTSTAEAYEDSLKIFELYFCGRRLEDGSRTRPILTENSDPWVDDLMTIDWTRYLSWRRGYRLGKPLPRAKPGRSRARSGSTPAKPEHVSARTVQKDRAVANKMMTWARAQGFCTSNPVADTESPKVIEREPVILTDEQFESLLDAASRSRQPMLRTYVLALHELGARSESEVLWLRWQDLDLTNGFVRIWSDKAKGHTTKGNKSRYVPMTPRFREALAEHVRTYREVEYDGKRSEWVFHHVVTRRHHCAGDRIKSLRAAFNNAVARARLPKEFVQHDLRHRRVTTWIAAGRDIAKVQSAVGHADIRTTLRYTHLVKEHLLSLVEDSDSSESLVDQMRNLIAQLEKLAG